MLIHQSTLPYCYYDKTTKRIVLKLITDDNIKTVKIIYGDPFLYTKKGSTWKWEYSETSMEIQYSTDCIMWQKELTPPPTRRMKYAFIVTDKYNKNTYFSEINTMEYSNASINIPHNHFFFPFVHEVDALHTPKWAEDICWYQIFPERFYNGNPDISPTGTADWEKDMPKHNNFFGGDLQGIIDKLPYLNSLGITGIYLTPIFLAPSNHKYDTADYFAIDPHFGDINTLKTLVKQAHALNMRVMLDAVVNHIGATHHFWQDVLKNQEKSIYKDYFHIHSFPVLESYPNRDALNYDTFAFASKMPKWNTENPAARKYLIDAAIFWIKECDIDAWRLDVSDEVSFDFWQEFKQEINKVKPDVYLLGELWHDPSKWLNGKYFDAVMNYPLGTVIRDMFILKSIDIETFAKRLAKGLMRFSDIHTKIQFNLLDSHDTARVLTQAGGDKLAIKNAFIFMYMIKGAPCIYYGTEIGMLGTGDPDCRRPMIWDPKKQDKELFEFFQKLIGIRKTYAEIIKNAAIIYESKNDFHTWRLINEKGELNIVYNNGSTTIKHDKNTLLASDTMFSPGSLQILISVD